MESDLSFCLCRVHVKRRRPWREYCCSMGMRACGIVCVTSWKVKAIPSVARTNDYEGLPFARTGFMALTQGTVLYIVVFGRECQLFLFGSLSLLLPFVKDDLEMPSSEAPLTAIGCK
jgi:hypothetical protein